MKKNQNYVKSHFVINDQAFKHIFIYLAGLTQMLGGVMRMLGYDETRLAGMGVNMVIIVMIMMIIVMMIMMVM